MSDMDEAELYWRCQSILLQVIDTHGLRRYLSYYGDFLLKSIQPGIAVRSSNTYTSEAPLIGPWYLTENNNEETPHSRLPLIWKAMQAPAGAVKQRFGCVCYIVKENPSAHHPRFRIHQRVPRSGKNVLRYSASLQVVKKLGERIVGTGNEFAIASSCYHALHHKPSGSYWAIRIWSGESHRRIE